MRKGSDKFPRNVTLEYVLVNIALKKFAVLQSKPNSASVEKIMFFLTDRLLFKNQ